MKTILLILIFNAAINNTVSAQHSNRNDMTPNGQLVFMTDFGTRDRFVPSMKGVAMGVSPDLKMHDLTHEIEPFNIWEASYTLAGTISYWPKGTVFVSVVDPGVGTDRRSVVARTADGKYVVTPDNGTLTLVDDELGITDVRVIDESVNRRPGTETFATFHGRDVYAYTGAKLASGTITFKETGPLLKSKLINIDYNKAKISSNGEMKGTIMKIEYPYGNPATNIPAEMLLRDGGKQITEWNVEIVNNSKIVYKKTMPFAKSFGYVEEGAPLLYIDSLGNIGLALNGGNFADLYEIDAGPDWQITLSPSD